MIKVFTALVATGTLLAASGCQSVPSNDQAIESSKTSHSASNIHSTPNIKIKDSTPGSTQTSNLPIDEDSMVYSGSYRRTTPPAVANPQVGSGYASSSPASSLKAIQQQPMPVSDSIITTYESVNALKMAKQNPELSIMVEAIEAAGIAAMIRFAGDGYTILAPNNEAFYKLFQETTLTKELLLADKSLLRYLLSYHVIKTPQPLSTTQMRPSTLLSLNKKKLTINNQRNIIDEGGRIAQIVTPNIVTKNGNVHIIDRVLFPNG